jgi:hypothetical protein
MVGYTEEVGLGGSRIKSISCNAEHEEIARNPPANALRSEMYDADRRGAEERPFERSATAFR